MVTVASGSIAITCICVCLGVRAVTAQGEDPVVDDGQEEEAEVEVEGEVSAMVFVYCIAWVWCGVECRVPQGREDDNANLSIP